MPIRIHLTPLTLHADITMPPKKSKTTQRAAGPQPVAEAVGAAWDRFRPSRIRKPCTVGYDPSAQDILESYMVRDSLGMSMRISFDAKGVEKRVPGRGGPLARGEAHVRP